ncbi:hypothetical protein [Pseudocowpox virus]|uniref:FEN1-like nuclease n=1 Tax=Pseudocowpox virus TaxID=129726 RepID=D3IZI8_9POXV|nr:hypothetical protein PCPV_gp043 [Pseudocowpox virus]ADC53942.1 hypothetical protein [Pseudocowpox virus]
MGIKNLKALLLSHGSLTPHEPDGDERFPAVFVDGFSVMMTMAYSCADEDEFRAAVEERVQHWTSVAESGRLVVFLDRGEIPIKQPLREQRRKATRDRAARHREFIAAAEADAAAEAAVTPEDREKEKEKDEHAEFAEEIRAEKQLKLQRIRFQLSIASHDVVRSLIASTLARAGEAVEVVFCDGVDAEMVMCARGRAEAERCGRWPLLVTTDQDALLFTSTDRMEKIVSTVSACYAFRPTAEAEYLCKLAALANGCDFFPGLGGICVSVESLRRAALFPEFSARNAAVSLCTRPMRLATQDALEPEVAAEAVDFIARYAAGDENIYREVPPGACCGRAFVRCALAAEWAESLPAPTGLGVVADMIACLPERRDPSPAEVERLMALEARARGARVTDAMLAQTAQLLGYGAGAGADAAAVFAVSGAKGLMRRLCDTSMFFNAEYVEIESEPRLLKLR